MQEDSTLNQLVSLLYGETSIFEQLELEHVLDEEFTYRLKFEEMQLGKSLFPKVKFDVKQNVVSNILAYSQRTQMEASL